MTMTMKTTTRLGSLLLAMLLAACAAARKEPPPMPFTGTKWILLMEVPLQGPAPWVQFGDGRVIGFFGCNEITASFLQDTVGAKAIAIQRLERSGRLCDASVVAVERRLLEVFQSVSSYNITMDTMVMNGSGGTLRFKSATSPSVEPEK
jgi:heat shock protein HslJ